MKIPKISYIFSRIEHYAKPVSIKYHIPLVQLYLGCFISSFVYGSTIKDYFLYEFYLKNRAGKRQFLTGIKMEKWFYHNNDRLIEQELKSKEKSLLRFNSFMKRDWCGQNAHNTPEEYERFASKHEVGIVKPGDDCGGHGIEIISTSIEGGIYEYCKRKQLIIEEVICQHKDMGLLHPESINTIRIVTYCGKIIGCVLRIGVGKSRIDNASSGGIYAELDIEHGTVISKAYDYLGNSYYEHPDTKVQIMGYKVPLWDECKKMVAQACHLTEGVPLVGWDVVILPDTPSLIEVNEAPDIFLLQHPRCHGLRYTINNKR